MNLRNGIRILVFIHMNFVMAAQIIYVDLSAAGNNDGTSWSDAYTNLNTAIDSSKAGEAIWVAQGVYKPAAYPRDISGNPALTDRDFTFHLMDSVAMYGGFEGNSAEFPETDLSQRQLDSFPTILNGNIGDSISGFDNCYHVLISISDANTTIVDGFTIREGAAYDQSPNDWSIEGGEVNQQYGAGMFSLNSSATLKNVKFKNNFAWEDGGGLYGIMSSHDISDVIFESNIAQKGGGMHNAENSTLSLSHVNFRENSALKGGGMYTDESSGTLYKCTFENNGIGELNNPNNEALEGGGMYNTNGSALDISNVQFIGNGSALTNGSDTLINGGGMYNDHSNPMLTNVLFKGNIGVDGAGINNFNSNPILEKVTFSENFAINKGGGVFNVVSSPHINNSFFYANIASFFGGGICNDSVSSPSLTNVNLYSNFATSGGGMYNMNNSSPLLTNVNFYNNFGLEKGGGMYNNLSSPTLINVILSNNSCYETGGGMCNINESNPNLQDVSFSGNVVVRRRSTSLDDITSYGGGMYNSSSNPILSNVKFDHNDAHFGGGMCNVNNSSSQISSVVFEDNKAHNGGGMYNDSSDVIIKNAVFSFNEAQGEHPFVYFFQGNSYTAARFYGIHKGGGIFNRASNPEIVNTIIRNNIARYSVVELRDNIGSGSGDDPPAGLYYIKGEIEGEGGGMYNIGSNPSLINVTITNNKAESILTDNFCITMNDIFESKDSCISKGNNIYNSNFCCNGFGEENGGLLEMDSLILDNTVIGYTKTLLNGPGILTGNQLYLDSFPFFVSEVLEINMNDESNVNLALPVFKNIAHPTGPDSKWGTEDDGLLPGKGSLLINAGDNTLNNEIFDIVGQDRVLGDSIDIGAYEYTFCQQSTSFSSSGGWSNGFPDGTKNVLFTDNYNTAIGGSITACTCQIASSATLTIGHGDYLKVFDQGIEVLGHIVVEEGGLIENWKEGN